MRNATLGLYQVEHAESSDRVGNCKQTLKDEHRTINWAIVVE